MNDLQKIIRQREIKAQFLKGDRQAQEYEFLSNLQAALLECQTEIKEAKAEAQLWRVNNFAIRMYAANLEALIGRFIRGVFDKQELVKVWHELERDFNKVKQQP